MLLETHTQKKLSNEATKEKKRVNTYEGKSDNVSF